MISTHRNFGALNIDPGQLGISVSSKLMQAALAPSLAASVGSSVFVASTLIGIPLAIAGLVYSMFASKRAKREAEEKAKEAYLAALLKAVEAFMEKVGYRIDLLEFGYEFAGQFLDIWNRYMQTKSETDRRAIVNLLRNNGFDPTRFIGGVNVRSDEKLQIDQANNAEKHLTTRDFLVAIGYPVSVMSLVSGRFGIGVFNGIVAFGKVTTEYEAVNVKVQLEDFFIDEGINPFQMYKVAIYGEAYYPYEMAPTPQVQPTYTYEIQAEDLLIDQGINPLTLSSAPAIQPQGIQPEDVYIDQGIPPPSEYFQSSAISRPTEIYPQDQPALAQLLPSDLSLSLASMPIWGWVLLAGGVLTLLISGRR